MKNQFLPILCTAGLALPMSSQAAVVAWGSWTAVTNNTAIATPAGYTYGGVNINGSTTIINNGPGGTGGTNVTFEGAVATGNQPNISVPNATVGPITVGFSGWDFRSTGNNSSVNSAVGSPTTWTTVLDQVIGDFGSGATATINLSGLTNGTEYTVQFFSSTPDGNLNQTTRITSGGVQSSAFGTHAGGETRYIIATFTADANPQSFTFSGTEPTFSALVLGTKVPEPGAALLGGLGLLGLLRRRRN